MLKEERAISVQGAKARLIEAFRLACADHGLCAADARQLLKELNNSVTTEVLPQLPSLPVPDEAPQLWADRIGRKENPPAFIRRVYGAYLHGGFTRAMLRGLDPLLYQALAVWECRHPGDQLNELPKRFHRPRNTAPAPELS